MSLIDRFLKKNREQVKREETAAPTAADAAGSDLAQGSATPDFTTMLNEIEQIEGIIGGNDGEDRDDDVTTLDVSIPNLLKALPAELKSLDPDIPVPDEKVPIIIKNLFEQLARGRITARLADLVTRMPESLLAADYGDHLADEVTLPLPLVVNAIPPDALKQRTAKVERESALEGMPDVFGREPAAGVPPAVPAVPAAPAVRDAEPPPAVETAPAAPVVETVVTEAAPEPAIHAAPEPKPEVAAEPIAAAEPEPAPVTEPVAEETPDAQVPPPAAQTVPYVLVNEVDLNAASIRELVKNLPGIGPELAERIVAGRPYRSIFDLSKVPGIGPRLLRKLSGVPIPAGGVSTDEVEAILGPSDSRLPPLREVAERIAKISGISGCILSQSDGYVLASAWRRGEGQALGAIAPQIFKQIDRYFNLLHMEGPQSVTLFVEPRPVFITLQRDVFVIVFVPRSRFSIRRIEVIETVAAELVRRLHRTSNG